MKPWVPAAYEAFRDYRLGGAQLSTGALSVVRALLAGRREEAEALREGAGLAPREWRELLETLQLDS